MTSCDILIVGVGGQGVVTLGDLLAKAALEAGVSVSVVPSKGMAQRGGFVKTEIRLGHRVAGARIGQHAAHIVASMERAELLKALRFVRPGGDVVLYDHVWEPTRVLLGEQKYPSLDDVRNGCADEDGRWIVLRPAELPTVDGRALPGNIVLLGALFSSPLLSTLLPSEKMEAALAARWPQAAQRNLAAFRAGRERGVSV